MFRKLLALFLLTALCVPAFSQEGAPTLGEMAESGDADAPKFPRGAIPTDPEKIEAAAVFQPQVQAAEQVAYVPAHLQY